VFGLEHRHCHGTQEDKREVLDGQDGLPRVVGPGVENEHGNTMRVIRTPRQLLEHIGTEGFRAMDPDVWLNCVRRRIEKDRAYRCWSWADGNVRHVVSDVRFPNEAEMIREMGGLVVLVEVEPDTEVAPGVKSGQLEERTGHASDELWRDIVPDFVLSAPKPGLDILRGRTDGLLNLLLEPNE